MRRWVWSQGVDSLGFMVTRNKGYQLETKVRNNCYVVFVGGLLVDHLLLCYDHTGEHMKRCNKVSWFIAPWVEEVRPCHRPRPMRSGDEPRSRGCNTTALRPLDAPHP
jgi:hypothetical protein